MIIISLNLLIGEGYDLQGSLQQRQQSNVMRLSSGNFRLDGGVCLIREYEEIITIMKFTNISCPICSIFILG